MLNKHNYRYGPLATMILIVCLLPSCVKWNLDRREIASFNIDLIGTEQVGFVYKNDFLQKENDEFIIAGTTIDSSVLLSSVSDAGTLLHEKRDFGIGEGHRIISGPDNNSFLLATSEGDALLFELNKSEKVVNIDPLKKFADRKIGLIKDIRLFDMFIDKEGDFWLSGYLQQNFGGKRLLLLRLNENRKLKWIKTYGEGQTGYSLTPLEDGFVAILSEKGNAKFLTLVNQDGVFIWQKRIGSNLDGTALNVMASGEIAVTSYNNGDELRIIGFDKLEDRLIDLSIGNSGHLLPRYIRRSRLGNFVITAVNTDAVIDPGVSLLEINPSGDILWQKRYLPNRHAVYSPFKVQQVKDFGYCIFGISANFSGELHYFMIKTDEEGELRED